MCMHIKYMQICHVAAPPSPPLYQIFLDRTLLVIIDLVHGCFVHARSRDLHCTEVVKYTGIEIKTCKKCSCKHRPHAKIFQRYPHQPTVFSFSKFVPECTRISNCLKFKHFPGRLAPRPHYSLFMFSRPRQKFT